jgi:hypothetical protein
MRIREGARGVFYNEANEPLNEPEPYSAYDSEPEYDPDDDLAPDPDEDLMDDDDFWEVSEIMYPVLSDLPEEDREGVVPRLRWCVLLHDEVHTGPFDDEWEARERMALIRSAQ